MGAKKIKVVHFSRKPRALGNFSVESYFKQVRENLPEEFEAINIEMPYESSGFFKRLANAFYCIFKQGDINHITGDIHYVAAYLKKSKTILTILDCGMLHQTSGLKHKIFKWFWFTMPISRVKLITAISTATKEDIIHFTGCPEDKIKVVYVCINPAFKAYPKEFNTKEPRILQIGTAANKNLARLIPALEGISCKLVIVGKIGEDIRELISKHKINLELIDWRLSDEEILEEYKKCDILSLVSTLEGFGMPIVEANAIGRVVITGNTTSMPEIAGDAAVMVDPFDIEAIKNGFLVIIGNAMNSKHLIDRGYINSNKFFPISVSNEYAVYYRQVCNLK
jgi:glycosyltransferase involved in cell wall biosynthesis